MNLLFFLVSVP